MLEYLSQVCHLPPSFETWSTSIVGCLFAVKLFLSGAFAGNFRCVLAPRRAYAADEFICESGGRVLAVLCERTWGSLLPSTFWFFKANLLLPLSAAFPFVLAGSERGSKGFDIEEMDLGCSIVAAVFEPIFFLFKLGVLALSSGSSFLLPLPVFCEEGMPAVRFYSLISCWVNGFSTATL